MSLTRAHWPLQPSEHATRRAFEQLMDWMRKNRVSAIQADGTVLVGDDLSLIPIFDFDTSANGDPRLKMRDVYAAGSKAANFALDAADGGAQTVTLSASVSLTGINNLVGVEPINVRFDLASTYTLTLDGTAFEGPKLSFTGDYAAISFVDFGGTRITALGNEW